MGMLNVLFCLMFSYEANEQPRDTDSGGCL